MKVSTGQIRQLLELDASRDNVGDEIQELINRLKQNTKKKERQGKSRSIVDLDAAPFVPEGWEVEEHQKGGQFEWDVTKVNLFVSTRQQSGKTIQGHKLRKELKNKRPFNANLLDFLLAHPNLIPEEWKGKCVYFWGTIYCRSDGRLYVRFLCWDVSQWRWYWDRLDNDWRGTRLAAVSVS